MKLQQTLDAMKQKSAAKIPPEVLKVMQQATAELAASGMMEKVLPPGSKLPHFTLADEQEHQVSTEALLARGPLIVSFYRGVW